MVSGGSRMQCVYGRKSTCQKDIQVLEQGTSRSVLLAEFGAPIFREQKEGKRIDVFKFFEGSKSGWKVGRAVFHAAADVVTLGLWEIIGTPTEAIVKGEEVTVTVMYGPTDKVETFSVKGKNA
jgi:hypothetical protein